MALAQAALPTLYEYYTAGGINSGLSVDQPHFTLNDKNISLYSGAMHYFRIPKKYWRDRLRKLRAAGLNAVETYVPWNLHEYQNGTFDFGDGDSDMTDFLDIQEYLRIAQEEDLFAIVRPGPYICAEWEWGGFPSWLMRDKNMETRTSNQNYMSYVTRYFDVLLPILALFQFTNGGPIVAFQVENEYGGSPRRDLAYIEDLYHLMRDNGIKELLVTSDGAGFGFSGTIPSLLFHTVNFGSDPDGALNGLAEIQPGKPLMVMEFWTGWFDHWTEGHHTTTDDNFREIYDHILRYPASASMYMFHGGTNFGFLNGANIGGDGNSGFAPTTTSYDYDAPLSETGDYTGKYDIVKELIQQYSTVETLTPEQPEVIPPVAYPAVTLTETLSLEDMISQAPDVIQSDEIIPMELLPINGNSGQSYGYIVYRQEGIDIAANSELKIQGYVYDSVLVIVNGKLISPPLSTGDDLNGFGFWRLKDSTITLSGEDLTGATVDLVVENWGRGNYGGIDFQYKGLQEGVMINNELLQNWKIIPLEFKRAWNSNLTGWKTISDAQEAPALYKGVLNIEGEPKDTFVDLQDWKHGAIIVNGFVLGRYASIGPQQTLYLPAPFLHEGDNEIIVLEQFTPATEIKFSATPIFKTS